MHRAPSVFKHHVVAHNLFLDERTGYMTVSTKALVLFLCLDASSAASNTVRRRETGGGLLHDTHGAKQRGSRRLDDGDNENQFDFSDLERMKSMGGSTKSMKSIGTMGGGGMGGMDSGMGSMGGMGKGAGKRVPCMIYSTFAMFRATHAFPLL